MGESPDWDFDLVRRRVRWRRQELGLTIEEVAEAAGVSRFTIMRIERGEGCKASTLAKVRHALRLYVDQLTVRPQESKQYRVHRRERTRWMTSVPKEAYSVRDETDPDHVDNDTERRRLGSLGFQPVFRSVLESELPEGVTSHALMELHQPSWIDQHFGEEFVYATRGDSAVTVDGARCVLREGDSMCFDARLPHSYAPAFPVEVGRPAPQILIVIATRPHDRELGEPERPTPPTVRKHGTSRARHELGLA